MSGEVYFVEGGGRIKIGFSVKPGDRIKTLSTGSPHHLKLVGTMPGSYRLEKAIHQQLAEYRVQGEWFTDCEWVRFVVDTLLTEGPSAIGCNFEPQKKTVLRTPRLVPSARDDVSWMRGNPFEKSLNRILEIIGQYVSEIVTDARRREVELQLRPGALVNPLIRGHYTEARWIIAGKMALEIHELLDDLAQIQFRAIANRNQLPDAVVIDRHNDFARTLHTSFRRLFENPDLDVIDLGLFEWTVAPVDLNRPVDGLIKASEYEFSTRRMSDRRQIEPAV